MSDHLTIKTIASLVGKNERTIQLHVKKGYLPALKIEGAQGWRILTRDARKWASRMFGKELP